MTHSCFIDIEDDAIDEFMCRVGNQIYKLLPLREEGGAWKKLLDSLVLEVAGMQGLFPNHEDLLLLLAKLKGLQGLAYGMDFMDYRRTVFECCALANKVRGGFNVDEDNEG